MKEVYTPIQGKEAPTLDEKLYQEVDQIDLKILQEGTIVSFSGKHPASQYIVEVLGTPGDEREVDIWYIGSFEISETTGYPACFLPNKPPGCLRTKIENIYSIKIAEELEFTPGVMIKHQNYGLPEFCWEGNRIYADSDQTRTEPYMKILAPK
ncbi:hypothetical protein HOA91_03025 [Candidatus Woesearchaeota archaeon]|jgi:hypothetical protein|nr:hypothetical protein [Candidatus Woesearchaeota archaeon]